MTPNSTSTLSLKMCWGNLTSWKTLQLQCCTHAARVGAIKKVAHDGGSTVTLLVSLTCHCWLSAELHLSTNTNSSPEGKDTALLSKYTFWPLSLSHLNPDVCVYDFLLYIIYTLLDRLKGYKLFTLNILLTVVTDSTPDMASVRSASLHIIKVQH